MELLILQQDLFQFLWDGKMNKENFDLFLTLIKLKSFLISMVDQPEDCFRNFNFTEEYLARRCPDQKDSIVNLLKENKINSDCDIAFDETIHEKFKEIAINKNKLLDLPTLLSKFEIDAKNINVDQKQVFEREKSIKEILDTLFHIAKNWAARKELESDVESYSTLEEEELIRPEEEKKLDKLDNYNSISFNNISILTRKYIEQFTDYYFKYGGDISLEEFLNYIPNLRQAVTQKYKSLFKDHGLDKDL